MSEKFEKLLNGLLVLFIIEAIILLVIYRYLNEFMSFFQVGLIITNGVLLLLSIFISYSEIKQRNFNIQQVLGKESKQALAFGNIGLVTLDEEFNVTWISDIFDESCDRFIGEKIVAWIPEISEIIRGNSKSVIAGYRNRVYEITRFSDGQTLFFKDVTQMNSLQTNYQLTRPILGMVVLDNYEVETQYEDEQKVADIDMKLRLPIIEWANQFGMYCRRLQNDRFLIILNEQIYDKLVHSNFDVLKTVKKRALENDISITLSIALGKGSNDFRKLEELTYQALELTQNRGGDQVVVKSEGLEPQYFGNSSQSNERESKVKVRAMANMLRQMILNSENVIIVGHRNMDFDCIGGAMAMAKIVRGLNRKVSLVTRSGGLESKLQNMMAMYEDELSHDFEFVTQAVAKTLIKPSTLLLMVDHHTKEQSNGDELIGLIKKIGVVDHHRRVKDFDFNPMFIYQEPNASSTVELVSELFDYQKADIELSELEATILYTGLVIDTNHFRVRSGIRTFESAARLKDFGADLNWTEKFLRDDFEEFELKSDVVNKVELVWNYAIVCYDSRPISRTLMSQVADELLRINGVEASFVIAQLEDMTQGVSARSSQQVNVQRIMEALGGGGHFNAAAYQTADKTVAQLYEELMKVLKQFQEEDKDESNFVE